MKKDRAFYMRDALSVARELIGTVLVHKTPEGVTAGRIVEVEAYLGKKDKAAHSYKGSPSGRTKIQYGEGGFAYIFLIYGMHCCMNVVTNQKDIPEVVLIRALEPLSGLELMKKRRGQNLLESLCSGPGKLCQSMGITRDCYGLDLCGSELYIEDGPEQERVIVDATKRINVDYAEEAADYPWRFTLRGSRFLSVKSGR